MREAINKKDINLSFKIFSEDERGLSFGLTKDQVIVGKNKNCDVVLDNEQYADYEIIFFKTKEGHHFARPLHHYEELLINDDASKTKHEKIMLANDTSINLEMVDNYLHQLEQLTINNDLNGIKDILLEVVEGFKPQN